ncbi:hypothetical protein ACFV98_02785 [Streptomyces violascens]|uniref:hypothetical protein n=1 Tax=Streptomyces violascens TaxID=67381 RepID=UPI0036505592
MTRYGFAIKALPKGGKPFEDDEKDDAKPEDTVDAGSADDVEADAPPGAPGSGGEAEQDSDAPDTTDDTETNPEDPGIPQDAETPPPANGSDPAADDGGQAPPGEESDARPWSGDMYDEGDETDPANAFAAYTGTNGEEAWLDQAPDGTLTGWVRDATGQVWRYSDPDVWAIDVDDAQMARTHSRDQDDSGEPSAARGGQDPLFPPQQKQS